MPSGGTAGSYGSFIPSSLSLSLFLRNLHTVLCYLIKMKILAWVNVPRRKERAEWTHRRVSLYSQCGILEGCLFPKFVWNLLLAL